MALKDMSKFQLIFTGAFAGFFLIGVAIFALYKASDGGSSVPVVIWGTIDSQVFAQVMTDNGLERERIAPRYFQLDADDFDQVFLEAIADGRGPDVVVLSQDEIMKYQNKIFPIPYASFDEKTFRETYVQGAELFISPQGIVGMPFLIDPYVMYWNRNTFQNATLPQAPKYWDEFLTLVPALTKRDGTLNITHATIGFGEYRNVTHAKELLSLLVMQAGSPITMRDGQGLVRSVFGSQMDIAVSPAQAAVNFFTEFSNPAKTTYTWNRSLPESKEAFVSGDLAVYFGPASELKEIQAKNPNLNFDVTYVPQSREAEAKMTYGKIYAFGIVRTSKNIGGAFGIVSKFIEPISVASFAKWTGLPPVRRDLLAQRPVMAHQVVFWDSALWSRAWLDPHNAKTDKIFMDMIESVTGGRTQTAQAISKADAEVNSLLQSQGGGPAAAPLPTSGMMP